MAPVPSNVIDVDDTELKDVAVGANRLGDHGSPRVSEDDSSCQNVTINLTSHNASEPEHSVGNGSKESTVESLPPSYGEAVEYVNLLVIILVTTSLINIH